METILNISLLAEVLACITGLIFWRKFKNSFLKYFPLYLLFIVVAEFIGRYLRAPGMHVMDKILYTYIVIPAEFLFFFWIFYRAFHRNKYRYLPVIAAVIYILSWLIDMLFLSTKQFWFYSASYTMGNLLLLILIFRFFIELVTTNDILYFKTNILFWICSGLLLFYLGTFPYFGLLNTIASKSHELHLTYWYIMETLNCLMYFMFTIGFIWGKPSTKYS